MPDETRDSGDGRPLDTSKWDEQPAVTGRPNDTPIDEPAEAGNSTFASRAAQRKRAAVGRDKQAAGDRTKAEGDKPVTAPKRTARRRGKEQQ